MAEHRHPTDEELLLAGEGVLPNAISVEVHVARCPECRLRRCELEQAMADFAEAREASARPLPAHRQARASLQLRMAQVGEPRRTFWQWMEQHALVAVCSGVLGIAIGLAAIRPWATAPMVTVRSIPDPRLTPGETLPVSKEDVCSADDEGPAPAVPSGVAMQVFAAYGIDTPAPRAYEVDYLVTPALGGSASIRNFWPQPYRDTVWTAHIKDALEDRLRQMVCGGQIDLATAQQELARDWIGAYKKHFQTERPLAMHVAFLKDRPWE